jgi:hypothetical protein
VKVATALVRVAVTRNAVPSMKVIDPVGVGPPVDGGAGITVAVKVTGWPRLAGLSEEVSVVVVLACCTVTVMLLEVLGEKLELPWYIAVTVLKPKGSAVVTMEATPPDKVAVPSEVVPRKNWTVPSGVPAVELTPAVSVTGWPTTAGLGDAATVVVVAGKTVWVKTCEVLELKLVSPW